MVCNTYTYVHMHMHVSRACSDSPQRPGNDIHNSLIQGHSQDSVGQRFSSGPFLLQLNSWNAFKGTIEWKFH